MPLAASLCLHMAGMVFTAFSDAQVDARRRPRRPIPSGRVRRGTAGWLGVGLLLSGVVLGWVADLSAGGWRIGLVTSGLAVAVLLYDAPLEETPLGPLRMGACPVLSWLFGMSGRSPEVAPGCAEVFAA